MKLGYVFIGIEVFKPTREEKTFLTNAGFMFTGMHNPGTKHESETYDIAMPLEAKNDTDILELLAAFKRLKGDQMQ